MASKADNERIVKASLIWAKMIPYFGEGIAGYELINGKDIFTEEKLTTGDKIVDGLSLATWGISRVVGKGGVVKAAEIDEAEAKTISHPVLDNTRTGSELKPLMYNMDLMI